MDDFSWKKLLTKVYDVEANCLEPKRKGPYDIERKYIRIDLPHILGVHPDPVVSYQMTKQLSLMLHENFTSFTNTPMAFEYHFHMDTEPFSAYMSRIMDDEAWREVIYDIRDLRFDCTNDDHYDVRLDLQDYVWQYNSSYILKLRGLFLGNGIEKTNQINYFEHEIYFRDWLC